MPSGTPCREINADGYSVLLTKVALTAEITGLIQRARAEMAAAAARARRLAKVHRMRRGKETAIAARHSRKALVARGSKKTMPADV